MTVNVSNSSGPEVSIVMPTFNVAPFVRTAVESVRRQSFPDFELVVVDDGSTDGTPDIVAGIDDPRVWLIRRLHESPVAALNFGVEAARGAYIGFLDGDDWWMENKLETHLRFLRAHPESDLTFSQSRIVDEQGRDTGLSTRPWNGVLTFSRLLADNVIGNGSAVVLRREALAQVGLFDRNLEGCYDLDLWLRVARQRPGNIHCIPEELTVYRRRAAQLTKDVAMMERAWLRLLDKMKRLEPERTLRVANTASSNMYRFLAYTAYESGRMGHSCRLLARSCRYSPSVFLADSRNWGLGAAILASVLLPAKWSRALVSRSAAIWNRLRKTGEGGH